MNFSEIERKLKEPFSADDVEWKIQVTSRDKTSGMAVPYLDSRAIQNRLDETVGICGWANKFMLWQEKSQICGISIQNPETGEWVTKMDGAENTQVQAIKGGISDAFKRAAVMWGIGRYLYNLDSIWVSLEQKGSVQVIRDSERGKLRAHYENYLKRLDGENHQSYAKSSPPRAGTSAEKPQYDFWVKKSVKTDNYATLILADKSGKEFRVFFEDGENAPRSGSYLHNASIKREYDDAMGDYFVLDSYSIAA